MGLSVKRRGGRGGGGAERMEKAYCEGKGDVCEGWREGDIGYICVETGRKE